jgi:hypothetical protein
MPRLGNMRRHMSIFIMVLIFGKGNRNLPAAMPIVT